VARKLPGTRNLDRPRRVRRLAGMLARKGYPPGVAMRVVEEAIGSGAEGDDDGAGGAEQFSL
ncbi:MAG TPA: RecX family transcriptional regulator, partial [Streptosporangiales bacterium]